MPTPPLLNFKNMIKEVKQLLSILLDNCHDYDYGYRRCDKAITREGYFHLINMDNCNFSWIYFPFKLFYRLKESILDLKIKVSKITTKIVITIFKIEAKLSRVAYMNQLINKLV